MVKAEGGGGLYGITLWKGITKKRKRFQRGIKFIPGDGSTISSWHDVWLREAHSECGSRRFTTWFSIKMRIFRIICLEEWVVLIMIFPSEENFKIGGQWLRRPLEMALPGIASLQEGG